MKELPYLPSVETALQYSYSTLERLDVRENRQHRVVSTPGQVKEQLMHRAERYGADEVLILSPIYPSANEYSLP